MRYELLQSGSWRGIFPSRVCAVVTSGRLLSATSQMVSRSSS